MHFEYEERTSCVCGQPLAGTGLRVERRYAWGGVTFLQCRSCGSWCQSPRITPASLGAWYSSDAYLGSAGKSGATYADYRAEEDARLAEAAGRVRFDLAPLLPPRARILEVGCATGSLLCALRDAGYRVTGLDLSPALAAEARARHGLEVLCADVLDAQFDPGSFDAVLLFGTVSNLQGLHERLARMRGWLTDDGLLIFNFIDAGSWLARLYGKRLWMFAPSADAFMTRRGCASALERSGFRLERIDTDRQRPSWQKLLSHARLGFLQPFVVRLGLATRPLPFPVPIPLARLTVARKR